MLKFKLNHVSKRGTGLAVYQEQSPTHQDINVTADTCAPG